MSGYPKDTVVGRLADRGGIVEITDVDDDGTIIVRHPQRECCADGCYYVTTCVNCITPLTPPAEEMLRHARRLAQQGKRVRCMNTTKHDDWMDK